MQNATTGYWTRQFFSFALMTTTRTNGKNKRKNLHQASKQFVPSGKELGSSRSPVRL
jgi:hypothetical protein